MSDQQTILILDTAMGGCSAAVYSAGADRAVELVEAMNHGQAERLVPMIDEALQDAGVAYDDLTAVIATRGPGGFTGLRVGLATAKALGLALDIPVFGFSTLQALAFDYAAQGAADGSFATVVETRRDDFYVQMFDEKGIALDKPQLLSAQEVWSEMQSKVAIFIGDGAARFKTLVPEAVISENQTLPTLGASVRAFLKTRDVFMKNPEPLYLRGVDVSMSKKVQRKLQA